MNNSVIKNRKGEDEDGGKDSLIKEERKHFKGEDVRERIIKSRSRQWNTERISGEKEQDAYPWASYPNVPIECHPWREEFVEGSHLFQENTSLFPSWPTDECPAHPNGTPWWPSPTSAGCVLYSNLSGLRENRCCQSKWTKLKWMNE